MHSKHGVDWKDEAEERIGHCSLIDKAKKQDVALPRPRYTQPPTHHSYPSSGDNHLVRKGRWTGGEKLGGVRMLADAVVVLLSVC